MITSNVLQLKDFKIEVTYKCPLACIHCSSDSLPTHPLEMQKDKCLSIIKEAADMGVKKITLSGGEPLLWNGIDEAVIHAKKAGMQITVYTSGNIPNIGTVLRKLKTIGLSRLIFSLYYSCADQHQEVTRRKGSYEATIMGIKQSMSLDIETELHFVALKRNYRDLNNVVRLGKKYGISKFSILRFVPQGRGGLLTSDLMDRIQYLELKRNIEELKKDKTIDIRTGSPFNFLFVNEDPSCLSGIDRLIIMPDLSISPCDAFKGLTAEDIVGTIDYSSLSSHSLKDCWEKSPYLNSIRKYLSSDFGSDCKTCTHLKSCSSGCLAQKVLKYGALKKAPDPDCIK